VLLFANPMQWI